MSIDREKFEQLSPEEQEAIFRESPFAEKGELLIRSHDPARLTRSLSQEELYLMTREMDIEERSEVMKNATFPQMVFVADMECWEKDRISRRGFLLWLETLLATGTQKTLQWLLAVDYETLVAGFQEVLEVAKPDWEYASDEVLADRPYFTIDDSYHLYVAEESLHLVKRVMELLFENHRGRYIALMEGLLGESGDLVEEEAYRLREVRLSERGFPDIESARRVYRRITSEEFKAFPRKNLNRERETGRSPVPNYPALWTSQALFLDQVFLLFKQETPGLMEGIEEELAWLSNKVIAAQGIDFSSEPVVRRGVSRARQFVSIGLEILSGGHLEKAGVLLKECWLETIFRTTATRLWTLRDRSTALIRNHWDGRSDFAFETLDSAYSFIFRGLFEEIPQTYDPAAADHVFHLRDFRALAELERAERAVSQIETLLAWLTSAAWKKGIQKALEEVRVFSESGGFFAVLGTVFARFVLELKEDASPLSETAALRFFKSAFDEHSGRTRLLPKVKTGFLQKNFSAADQALLLPVWALIFEDFEAAVDGAAEEEAVFRLRSALWIKYAAKRSSPAKKRPKTH